MSIGKGKSTTEFNFQNSTTNLTNHTNGETLFLCSCSKESQEQDAKDSTRDNHVHRMELCLEERDKRKGVENNRQRVARIL